jgi:glutathione peroxidase
MACAPTRCCRLEDLYSVFQDRGFVVIGVPSNDFAGQEPGTNEEIKAFARDSYGATFPLMSKSKVTGPDAIPLYKWLTANAEYTGPVDWNFEKFLVGQDGLVKRRFAPSVDPYSDDLVQAIDDLLGFPEGELDEDMEEHSQEFEGDGDLTDGYDDAQDYIDSAVEGRSQVDGADADAAAQDKEL